MNTFSQSHLIIIIVLSKLLCLLIYGRLIRKGTGREQSTFFEFHKQVEISNLKLRTKTDLCQGPRDDRPIALYYL